MSNIVARNQDRFEFLNGKLFTANELCEGAGITRDMLASWTKMKFPFVSPNPGQGKTRLYALLDVYTCAIMGEISRLTGNAKECILCLHTKILAPVLGQFEEEFGREMTESEFQDHSLEWATKLTHDLSAGPVWMTNRSPDQPSLLILHRENERLICFTDFQSADRFLKGNNSVVAINITRILMNADMVLSEMKGANKS